VKDGIFVVLVPAADPAWIKVGQLTLLDSVGLGSNHLPSRHGAPLSSAGL
jgi:hypothetical protein